MLIKPDLAYFTHFERYSTSIQIKHTLLSTYKKFTNIPYESQDILWWHIHNSILLSFKYMFFVIKFVLNFGQGGPHAREVGYIVGQYLLGLDFKT